MSTIPTRRPALLAMLALSTLAAPAAAQDFEWTGRLAAGRTLEVKNVNGEIEAVAAAGDEIRVTATKRARRSDPDDVRIEVVEHGDGVTICAVYPPGPDGRDNECAPGSGGRMNSHRNDTNVSFRVEVPRGVRFSGRTVNGGVSARGLDADIDAHTVNGSIDVSTNGLVRASTVNGGIDVEMGRADWTDDLDFETVNGNIALTLTGDVHAEVSASTVNGSISTDYPLTIQGRFGPKRLRGTIGDGGRSLSMATVNGSIELRRR
jgi:hypothetical protein